MSYRIPGEWKGEPVAKEPNAWVDGAKRIIKSPWLTLSTVTIAIGVFSTGMAIHSCIAYENAKDARIERAEVACAREGMDRLSQHTVDGQLWAVCFQRVGEYEVKRLAVKVTP